MVKKKKKPEASTNGAEISGTKRKAEEELGKEGGETTEASTTDKRTRVDIDD